MRCFKNEYYLIENNVFVNFPEDENGSFPAGGTAGVSGDILPKR